MAEFLTIGIPVWNDLESLDKSIKAITSTTAWQERKPSEREIIVCINGVTDFNETSHQSIKLKRKFPGLKVLTIKRKGKNAALNHIARKSSQKAKKIFFCDSDILVKRETISRTLNALNNHPEKKFAATLATPATAVIPQKSRSAFKAYQLKRARDRLVKQSHYLSGAAYAVDKSFFRNNPLPETNRVADDIFINQEFVDRIITVHDAKVFYLLPSPKDRILQKARYLSQSETKTKRKKIDTTGYTNKEKRGLIINNRLDDLAKLLITIRPKLGWRKIKSTKLVSRKKRPI